MIRLFLFMPKYGHIWNRNGKVSVNNVVWLRVFGSSFFFMEKYTKNGSFAKKMWNNNNKKNKHMTTSKYTKWTSERVSQQAPKWDSQSVRQIVHFEWKCDKQIFTILIYKTNVVRKKVLKETVHTVDFRLLNTLKKRRRRTRKNTLLIEMYQILTKNIDECGSAFRLEFGN